MPTNSRIVKVQLPLAGNVDYVLIYDKSREWLYHGPYPKKLVKRMRGKVRAFFHATLTKNGLMHINNEATEEEYDAD